VAALGGYVVFWFRFVCGSTLCSGRVAVATTICFEGAQRFDHRFIFVVVPGLEATNNRAERAI